MITDVYCTSNFSMTARWRLDLVLPDFPLPFAAAGSDNSLPEMGTDLDPASVVACEEWSCDDPEYEP